MRRAPSDCPPVNYIYQFEKTTCLVIGVSVESSERAAASFTVLTSPVYGGEEAYSRSYSRSPSPAADNFLSVE